MNDLGMVGSGVILLVIGDAAVWTVFGVAALLIGATLCAIHLAWQGSPPDGTSS